MASDIDKRLEREQQMRAVRDEILLRRRERDSGPVVLVEILEPQQAARADGSYAPVVHIPTPASLRGRRITRVCFPPSAFGPAAYQTPGLYRSEARGLVHVAGR